MAGLYIHIPYCKQACHYCDFHFSTDLGSRSELTKALAEEMNLRKDYIREPVETIYFGGGTPSLLSGQELGLLLDQVNKSFSLSGNPEITLEANPDDLTKETLRVLKASGINRLSVGIQSFDNSLLTFLNRVHHGDAARICLAESRDAGFSNISVDLIFAIPGLTEKKWEETLREVIDMAPEHISSYSLTIEEKTVFGNWRKKGKLHVSDEETTARQFEMATAILEDGGGYEQYEVSNFSKPGFHSRHNSSYWTQQPYIGIGPSAHSYDRESRQFNVRNNPLYLKSIKQGIVPFEREILTRENKINEYILTTLRTTRGCDLTFLKEVIGDDLATRRQGLLTDLRNRELIRIEGGVMFLTRKGRLLADKITEDLMVDD